MAASQFLPHDHRLNVLGKVVVDVDVHGLGEAQGKGASPQLALRQVAIRRVLCVAIRTGGVAGVPWTGSPPVALGTDGGEFCDCSAQ